MDIDDLGHLEIHEKLVVDDTMDYKLGAARIDVGGPVSYSPTTMTPGIFRIGDSSSPFQHSIVITLTDHFLSSSYQPTAPALENQSFVVHGGSDLQLHGRDLSAASQPRKSWLRLANNSVALAAASTSMTLESTPGWNVGDTLVITPTDFNPSEIDIVHVTAVSGATVQFTPPLAHRHNSFIELGLVDERAEVGLLTHNIVITGTVSTSGGIKRGAHLMIHNMGTPPMLPNPTVNISQVAFWNMGWQGALGRYPIHFHMLGSMAGSYVRSSSVWLNHNRAITIHGTDDLEISDCVTLDTLGHSIYLEDKSEVRNQLLRNLVVGTHVPPVPTGLSMGGLWQPTTGSPSVPYFNGSDPQASAFWLTNTDNVVSGNVACGSEKHGYWLDPSTNIITVPAVPPYTVGGGLWESPPVTFTDNVAHSNGEHGFWNDFARLVANDPALSPPQAAEHRFINFTAYKNAFGGIWARSYGVSRWIGAKLADNRLGAYLASEGFQKDCLPVPPAPPFFNFNLTGAPGMSVSTMENSVVAGETTNNPSSLPVPALPYLERKGVELYDGMIMLIGVQFYNFTTTALGTTIMSPGGPMTHRVAMAITSQSFHSVDVPGDPWAVDPRAGLAACSFTNCTDTVLFPIPHAPGGPANAIDHNAIPGALTWSPNGVTSATIIDVFGNVPGGSIGSYVVNDTPLLHPGAYTAPSPLYGYYAPPLFVPGPGTTGNDAYAAMLFTIDSKITPPSGPPTWVNTAVNFIRVSSTTRGATNTLDVYDALRSGIDWPEKRFPTNVLLTRPGGTTEEYLVDYPSGASLPSKFTLKLQFSEAYRSALFGVAYSGTPPSSVVLTHELFPGFSIALTGVSTKGAVETGSGMEYFHDVPNGRLWLRPTLLDFSPFGLGVSTLHPLLTGRAMTIEVN